MIRPRALVAPLALVTALLAAYAGQGAGGREAQAQPDPESSACTVRADVSLSTKLSCPLHPVEVRYRVETACPSVEPELSVEALRLVSPFPDGVIGFDPGDGPLPDPGGGQIFGDGADEPAVWRLEIDRSPAAETLAAHWVQPLLPGSYLLGAAELEIEDNLGRTRRAAVQGRPLQVTAHCDAPRGGRIHLPLALRPSCLPRPVAVDVALLLDRSSSVGPEGWRDAASQLQPFLQALDLGRDRVAVLAFARGARLLAPLGGDRARLRTALDEVAELPPEPGTRIDEALRAGARALLDPRAGLGAEGEERRRVLVLLSDGVPFGSGTGAGGRNAARAAARDARAQGLSIASLALGPAPDLGLLSDISDGNSPPLRAPHADPDGLARRVAELAAAASSTCGALR